jgi:hypothetical protein
MSTVKYSLTQNKNYVEKKAAFERIIQKERETEKEIDGINISDLKQSYDELFKKQFIEEVKEVDLKIMQETWEAASNKKYILRQNLQMIRQVKPILLAEMRKFQDVAIFQAYKEALIDFKPIFREIVENLKRLNELHGQIENIIADLEAAGVPCNRLESIRMILMMTGSFNPGHPSEDGSPLSYILRRGKEENLFDK